MSLLAGALQVAPAPPLPAGTLVVRAEAGLGGLVKNDRSVPVRVVIDYAGPEIGADLVVSWGDASVSRRVTLASSGRRTYELYVRTSESEDAVHVGLYAGGAGLQTLDAPVRVLDQDEPVTLCIVPPGGDDTAGCSTTLTPDALPSSPRGYEVADRVILTAGEVLLSAQHRKALDVWQALRGLDRHGDLGVTPQPVRPMLAPGLPPDTARRVTVLAGLYVACLMTAGLIVSLRRDGAVRALAVLTAVTALGSLAAFALGRVGPGQAIQVHHSSLLQQIPGTSASVVTAKAVAVFPALETFQLELAAADSMLEAGTASGRAVQRVTDEGHPVLSGRFGLGARQSFVLEAVVEMQPLGVTLDSTGAHVRNLMDRPLYDCRFGDGFRAPAIGVLEAGASVSAERVSESFGPVLTCTLPEMAVRMVDAHHPVESTGATIVTAYASQP